MQQFERQTANTKAANSGNRANLIKIVCMQASEEQRKASRCDGQLRRVRVRRVKATVYARGREIRVRHPFHLYHQTTHANSPDTHARQRRVFTCFPRESAQDPHFATSVTDAAAIRLTLISLSSFTRHFESGRERGREYALRVSLRTVLCLESHSLVLRRR